MSLYCRDATNVQRVGWSCLGSVLAELLYRFAKANLSEARSLTVLSRYLLKQRLLYQINIHVPQAAWNASRQR